MQFKVPQDVQQADRIVWFLTLPQLIICVVGFAIAYGIYSVLNQQGLPLIIWLPPVAIVALLTCAFAFLRIANLSFHRYLALLIERFVTPSKRVWVKGADRVMTDEKIVSTEDKKISAKKEKREAIHASKVEQLQSISELSEQLDISQKDLPSAEEAQATQEIDETTDESLVKKAFLDEGAKKDTKKTTDSDEIEAKIMEISKAPTDNISPEDIQPKKKRRRRRRRKKNTTLETPEQPAVKKPSAPQSAATPEPPPEPMPAPEVPTPVETQQTVSEPPKKKRRRRRKKKPMTDAAQPTAEPPLPIWLQENPESRSNEPAQATPAPPPQATPVPAPTPEPQPAPPQEPAVAEEPLPPVPAEKPAEQSYTENNPVKPAQTSGEFKPEDLQGEGQTITFPEKKQTPSDPSST